MLCSWKSLPWKWTWTLLYKPIQMLTSPFLIRERCHSSWTKMLRVVYFECCTKLSVNILLLPLIYESCIVLSFWGSYLLSSGYECVLVKWMTETTLKKPDTLPRLSAPIVNISCSPDNQLYAVSYIDNGYFLHSFLWGFEDVDFNWHDDFAAYSSTC